MHEPGVVREIRFQVPRNDPNGTKLDDLIILNWEGANKLIYLIRSLDSIPVCSGDIPGFDDGSRRQRASEGRQLRWGDVMNVDRAVRGSSHSAGLRKVLDCPFGLRFCSPPSYCAGVQNTCGDEAVRPEEVEA